jgi:hypothetical protein
MRDQKRRRIADDPLGHGWAHALEVLLGAGMMLGALLWYLILQHKTPERVRVFNAALQDP